VASYVPWALTAGPSNVPAAVAAGAPQLFVGWPPGHTGQTFLDLQAEMYRYHNEFRWPHGASSPWWAWPFDLKPIWAYLENMVGNTQATILDAGNPFLFWLAIPAAGFGMWQAWRRREAGLAFVAIVFLALWLPWARVDRVIFNYHFHAALPFFFLLLAYFLAELWDGPSPGTWLLARISAAAVLLAPALLWIAAAPLCGVAGVSSAYPQSKICTAGLFGGVPAWAWYWLLTGIICGGIVWWLVRPRLLVALFLLGATATFVALYPALTAMQLPNGMPTTYQGVLPTWDSSFQFASNQKPMASNPILGIGTALVLAGTIAVVAAAMIRAGFRWPPTRTRLNR
jgi:hypothetical protein